MPLNGAERATLRSKSPPTWRRRWHFAGWFDTSTAAAATGPTVHDYGVDVDYTWAGSCAALIRVRAMSAVA